MSKIHWSHRSAPISTPPPTGPAESCPGRGTRPSWGPTATRLHRHRLGRRDGGEPADRQERHPVAHRRDLHRDHGTGKKGANAGTIEIGNATLAIGGTFDNSGAIIETGLSFFRLNADTKLSGGGQVTLDGSFLFGAAGGLTLTNVDNTIVGAGGIGTAQGMSLANRAAGVIDATGSLTLEMGGGTVTNAGLLEATGGGDLILFNTAVDGSGGGVISAKDGSMVILGGADIIGGTLKSSGTGFIETGGTIPQRARRARFGGHQRRPAGSHRPDHPHPRGGGRQPGRHLPRQHRQWDDPPHRRRYRPDRRRPGRPRRFADQRHHRCDPRHRARQCRQHHHRRRRVRLRRSHAEK